MRVQYFIDANDRGEGCGHPSRGLPGMLEHRRVSSIIASCIVRAVPFGVHDREEKWSFVHFRASVTYARARCHNCNIPLLPYERFTPPSPSELTYRTPV